LTSIPLSTLGISDNPNTTPSGEITANVFIDSMGKYKAYIKTSDDSNAAYFSVDLNSEVIEKYFHITHSNGQTGNPIFQKKINSSGISIEHPLEIKLRTTRNFQKNIYDRCNSIYKMSSNSNILSNTYGEYEKCVLSIESIVIKPEPPSCLFDKKRSLDCLNKTLSSEEHYFFDFALTQSNSNIFENAKLYESCQEANLKLLEIIEKRHKALLYNKKGGKLLQKRDNYKQNSKYYNATARMISCATNLMVESHQSGIKKRADILFKKSVEALKFMEAKNTLCKTCRAHITDSAVKAMYVLTDTYDSRDRTLLATRLSTNVNFKKWDYFYSSYTGKDSKFTPKSAEQILVKLNKIEDCEIREKSCASSNR
jgi:hypothetical protein